MYACRFVGRWLNDTDVMDDLDINTILTVEEIVTLLAVSLHTPTQVLQVLLYPNELLIELVTITAALHHLAYTEAYTEACVDCEQ